MKTYVIGNGSSLLKTPLELLQGQRTFAVNRIWKLFGQTDWRPTDYVRCELPEYDGEAVCDDIKRMSKYDCRLWMQAGFFRYVARRDMIFGFPVYPFLTCQGDNSHDWHLDLGDYICGYGTVVQVAIQIAILQGADHIFLLGCDLGQPAHFYGEEGRNNDDKNIRAHENALRCSPVPIYNCTLGGGLEVYPRLDLMDVLNKDESWLLEKDQSMFENKTWLYGKETK